MDEFRCVTQTIKDIQDTLDELQTALTETMDLSRSIQTILTNQENWQGEAQLVGAAFLDLVIQYHEKLSSGKKGGPVDEAIETLKEYLTNDSDFYSQWSEYKSLSDI